MLAFVDWSPVVVSVLAIVISIEIVPIELFTVAIVVTGAVVSLKVILPEIWSVASRGVL